MCWHGIAERACLWVSPDKKGVISLWPSHLQAYTYLKEITVTKFRKIFTRLRLGILDLQCNKTLYDEKINTLCKVCKQEDEDELHFILRCPGYTYLRQKYILKHWPDISKISLNDLLGTQDNEQIRDISMFTYYATKRKEYLIWLSIYEPTTCMTMRSPTSLYETMYRNKINSPFPPFHCSRFRGKRKGEWCNDAMRFFWA